MRVSKSVFNLFLPSSNAYVTFHRKSVCVPYQQICLEVNILLAALLSMQYVYFEEINVWNEYLMTKRRQKDDWVTLKHAVFIIIKNMER